MGLELRLLQQLEAVPPANWRQTTTAGDKTITKKKAANKLKELRRKHQSYCFVLEGFIGYMEDLVEFHLDGFRMKRNAL